MSNPGQKQIPAHKPNITSSDHIAVSLAEPRRLLRLDKPATAAPEVIHGMAVEHDRLGKQRGFLVADATIHGCKMDKADRKSNKGIHQEPANTD